jgi:hypothetical protein
MFWVEERKMCMSSGDQICWNLKDRRLEKQYWRKGEREEREEWTDPGELQKMH